MFLGPSNDSSIMDVSVNNNNAVRIVMWEKPSNNEDFILESYVVTLRNSSGDNIIDGPTTLPPDTQSIRYDELQTGNYSFNLTVINSCGDVASIIYEFQVSESMTVEQSKFITYLKRWQYQRFTCFRLWVYSTHSQVKLVILCTCHVLAALLSCPLFQQQC